MAQQPIQANPNPVQVTCCDNLVFAWRAPQPGEEAVGDTNILVCGSCGQDWKPGSPFAPEPVVMVAAPVTASPPLPPLAIAEDDIQAAILVRLDAILINTSQSQQQAAPINVSGGAGVFAAAWTYLLDGLDQNASWGKNKLREYMLECFKMAGGEGDESGNGAEEEGEEEPEVAPAE